MSGHEKRVGHIIFVCESLHKVAFAATSHCEEKDLCAFGFVA